MCDFALCVVSETTAVEVALPCNKTSAYLESLGRRRDFVRRPSYQYPACAQNGTEWRTKNKKVNLTDHYGNPFGHLGATCKSPSGAFHHAPPSTEIAHSSGPRMRCCGIGYSGDRMTAS